MTHPSSVFGAPLSFQLPHDLHVESSIQAFEAGLHVLLEKPMARTVKECDEILAAAQVGARTQ